MPKQQHSRLPWIRQLVDYSYNSQNGKLRSVTYANGLTVAYAYNTLELLEEVCYTKNAKNGETVTAYEYTYTNDGQIQRFTDHESGRVTV